MNECGNDKMAKIDRELVKEQQTKHRTLCHADKPGQKTFISEMPIINIIMSRNPITLKKVDLHWLQSQPSRHSPPTKDDELNISYADLRGYAYLPQD